MTRLSLCFACFRLYSFPHLPVAAFQSAQKGFTVALQSNQNVSYILVSFSSFLFPIAL
jgi:hypothetical protein